MTRKQRARRQFYVDLMVGGVLGGAIFATYGAVQVALAWCCQVRVP